MKLFIATPVSLPLYGYLKERLSPFVDARWTLATNLHLTHYFIGEGDLKDYLFNLDVPNEKIELKEIGSFGNKILYLKAFSKHISLIHNEISKNLGKKPNKFIPHITLCRIKRAKDKEGLKNEMKKIKISQEIPFEVYLYSSTLTPKGAIYKKLHRY